MRVALGGLPKLEKCLYITCRPKHTHRPSLAIPIPYAHMLAKALLADNMTPRGRSTNSYRGASS